MNSQTSDTLERIKRIVTPHDRAPIDAVIRPFQRFIDAEEAGGIVLIVCTAIALFWANSAWADSYHALWETHLRIALGPWTLDYPLHHWVNDALMAIFFFYVGLEIKREILIGELSSARNAALPIAAAIGGMIVPALIYTLFNAGTPAAHGWGVPMATDIAFALGILALLGRRIPFGLTVFLAALAIADDLGAVVVIAVFYSDNIALGALGIAGAFLVFLMIANRSGVRRTFVYVFLGVFVWLAVLKSGVHATVAGVLIAMTVPTRTVINSIQFARRTRQLTDEFEALGVSEEDILGADDQEAVVQALETTCEQAQAPSQRMEHGLSKWVSFVIMPVFALANAGIVFEGDFFGALLLPVTLGVALGLVVGKQIGITLFSWIAVRLGIGALPQGVTWRHIYGAALLGGIGFTMSLFIAGLGFGDPVLLNEAKVGILVGSLVSAILGWLVLRSAPEKPLAESAP
ncbi:MAG TPA: Na+/H+ antiporter NhaA [Candidatus Kapabacteria bacterium]|nr:Na+/H+ antiporter NhaA [Candidatus Kapabacteria bacterium]